MNNNKRATKRALLTSVMALVMCVVMLVGTTFAWFTDTASTGVNKIQAGNLDVKLSYLTKEGWAEVKGTTKLFDDEALWEPGHTEVAYLKVENVGDLALKYQLSVNVANEVTGTSVLNNTIKLSDYIKMGVVDGQSTAFADRDAARAAVQDAGSIATYTKNGNIAAKGEAQYVAMVIYMPETVGNEANYAVNSAVPSIELGVKLYATQDTVEKDSFDDQYDKNAPAIYPAGVTEDSFSNSVDYKTWTGASAKAEATAAYVDKDGNVQYVADVTDAIQAGATTVYLKENATVNLNMSSQTNRTPALTNDLTVYANGADFQYGEIAMSYEPDSIKNGSKDAGITLKVYDAKNIRIFGSAPNAGVTQNVILENCTYEGGGVNQENADGIFYLSDPTGTINLTMNNCKVTGSNQGVYKACDGDVIVTNSSFEGCAAAMKISHKGSGTCNVTVKDTTFNKCGWDTDVADKTWLKSDSSAIKCKTTGTMTLTLDNVAITNMIGDKSIVTEDGVTVRATGVTVDGKSWNS